jgi:hypothetical protein
VGEIRCYKLVHLANLKCVQPGLSDIKVRCYKALPYIKVSNWFAGSGCRLREVENATITCRFRWDFEAPLIAYKQAAKVTGDATLQPDLCAAHKCSSLINRQRRCLDVATQRAPRLEFATLSDENVAFHRAAHFYGLRTSRT